MLLCVILTLLPTFRNNVRGQAPTSGINTPKEKPNNAAGGTKTSDPRGTQQNPFVVQLQTKEQTGVERDEGKKQATKAEADERYHRSIDRWTLIWVGLTAIATVFLVLVGIGGIGAAIRTLRAIEEQGRQMERQAALMEGQLQQAAKHLGVTERPWIRSSIRLNGPVKFNEQNRALYIPIVASISNEGHSPAIGVVMIPNAYVDIASHSLLEQDKMAHSVKAISSQPGFGEGLFPGNKLSEERVLSVAFADIEKGSQHGHFRIFIILGVGYRSTIDERARYCTVTAHNLSRAHPLYYGINTIFTMGEDVPLEDLILSSSSQVVE